MTKNNSHKKRKKNKLSDLHASIIIIALGSMISFFLLCKNDISITIEMILTIFTLSLANALFFYEKALKDNEVGHSKLISIKYKFLVLFFIIAIFMKFKFDSNKFQIIFNAILGLIFGITCTKVSIDVNKKENNDKAIKELIIYYIVFFIIYAIFANLFTLKVEGLMRNYFFA